MEFGGESGPDLRLADTNSVVCAAIRDRRGWLGPGFADHHRGMSDLPPSLQQGASSRRRVPDRIGLLHQGDRWWFAGVNYIHTVLRQLELLPDRPASTLLLKRGLDDLYDEVQADRIVYDGLQTPSVRNRIGRLRRWQWARSLGAAITRSRCEVVFPLQFAPPIELPVPWVGWIPDLQHLVMPENYKAAERDERDRRFGELLKRARLVVLSSECSRRDAIAFDPSSAERLRVVPFASVPPNTWWMDDPVTAASRLGLPDRFVLFPSQGWPHKGHATLIAALAKVPEVHLVLTGVDPKDAARGAWVAELVDRSGLGDRTTMLGFRTRREVFSLLRRAVAVVQPSRFEGWSLLVEDAIAAGRPIVLSDLPVHREQCPERVVPVHWFEPGDEIGLARMLGEAWATHRPGPQEELAEIGRHASEARGRASATLLLEVLGEAIDGSR
jgi:glycosyltransferase involved in cell wall biosynthesis